MPVKLYLLQRISAMVMAPLVLVHLVVIIYAMGEGLSASAILERTRGSVIWGLVYGTFVIAIAVHSAIGIRVIAAEWLGVKGTVREVVMWTTGILLALLGARAVIAVVVS
jgi:fumarate reductase subunit C